MVAAFVGGWGHAEPLLAVARLATAMGHEVTFAGQEAIVPRLAALGYRTETVGPVTLATTRLPLLPVDRDGERRVLADHFVARFGRQRVESLPPVFERAGATMVVCDEVDVGAVVAAERAGLPCVTVNVLASGRMATPAVVGAAWAGLRAAAGLGPDPDLARFGGDLAVVPVPRSFRDPAATPAGPHRFVRPGVFDGAGAEPPSRRVYATLGTIFNLESGDLVERLIAAAGLIEADVLVTIGPFLDPADLPAAAPRVRVEEFVPQGEVLPGAGAVVCHGGSGTLVAALALGVPVVVLPMGADQPDNADRVAELGVGIVLDPLTATPADIATATTTVLDDGRYRAAASALAREAAAQPPLAEVEALLALLG